MSSTAQKLLLHFPEVNENLSTCLRPLSSRLSPLSATPLTPKQQPSSARSRATPRRARPSSPEASSSSHPALSVSCLQRVPRGRFADTPRSLISLSHLSGTRTGPSLARAMPSGRGSGRPRQGVSFKERAELTRKEKHTKQKRQDLLPSRGRRQRESFHRHAQR